jgi:hypothetical protein
MHNEVRQNMSQLIFYSAKKSFVIFSSQMKIFWFIQIFIKKLF